MGSSDLSKQRTTWRIFHFVQRVQAICRQVLQLVQNVCQKKFDQLFEKVEARLRRQGGYFQEPVCAEEMLVITIT